MIKLKTLVEEFEANRSVVEKLQKYVNNNDVFVSYRDTPQLGINPKSEYNTPAGIYAYPIKCLLNLLGGNKFSFALNKYYVYVIKCKGNLLDISELNTNTRLAENLFNKIVGKYLLQQTYILTDNEYRKIFHVLKTSSAMPTVQKGGFGMNALNFQSSNEKNVSEVCIKVMNRLLIEDVFNLKPLINTEFSLSTISFSELGIEESIKEKLTKNYLFLQTMDAFINKTKPSENLGSLLWNMTRMLSGKNKDKWRTFFLDLEIYGVVDFGSGIIHSAEPCQVVFFSQKHIQVIEVISNI